MSFLIDCPTLVVGGETFARRAPERLQAGPARIAAAAGTLALFWGVSVPAYLNRPWTKRWVRLLGARDGRDWMINSGVLRLESGGAGRRTHAVGALLFAAYPLFLAAGYRHGRRARLARP